MKRRGWLACAISLVGHTLAVFGIAQLCAVLRSSPDHAAVVVNRVIDPPDDYGCVSISIADDVMPRQVTPVLPKDVTPPKERTNPAPRIEPKTPSAIEPKAPVTAGPKNPEQTQSQVRDALPLHGKLTRPGLSIVYVLDQSSSMARDGKLNQAIAMLKASLRQLSPDMRFQIVVYDSSPTILRIGGNRELAPATPENLGRAGTLLDDVIGEGSSRHGDGIVEGLSLHPDILILLTDTDDLSPTELARCRQWNRKDTTIHAVVFGDSSPPRPTLAQLTGPQRLHRITP